MIYVNKKTKPVASDGLLPHSQRVLVFPPGSLECVLNGIEHGLLFLVIGLNDFLVMVSIDHTRSINQATDSAGATSYKTMSPMAHSATTDDHGTLLLIRVPFATDQEHPGMLVDVPGDRSGQ